MKLVFLETPLFTRLLGDYLTDESYRRLQRALMENPEMGDVMPGTGGFRKVRWEDARRGKCVFHAKPATDSRAKLPPIPDESCH